jgi:uncharacterized membrane protein YjjP (DUF1212 family)
MQMQRIHQFLLHAGRLITASGGETSRVEQTVTYLGRACGLDAVQVIGLPTGLMLTTERGEESKTSVLAIDERATHLGRLDALNALSRDLVEGRCTFDEAEGRLAALESQHPPLEKHRKGLYMGLSCACWALVLGGSWADFVPTFVVGVLVNETMFACSRRRVPLFLVVYLAVVVGTMASVLAARVVPGCSPRSMLVGVVVPIVPGVALTSAIRDLMAGDLVSGVARGAEAVLQASAIVAAVGSVLSALGTAAMP